MPPERLALSNARRVVVKVGTAVVSNADGTLALSRLGALVEQVCSDCCYVLPGPCIPAAGLRCEGLDGGTEESAMPLNGDAFEGLSRSAKLCVLSRSA